MSLRLRRATTAIPAAPSPNTTTIATAKPTGLR